MFSRITKACSWVWKSLSRSPRSSLVPDAPRSPGRWEWEVAARRLLRRVGKGAAPSPLPGGTPGRDQWNIESPLWWRHFNNRQLQYPTCRQLQEPGPARWMGPCRWEEGADARRQTSGPQDVPVMNTWIKNTKDWCRLISEIMGFLHTSGFPTMPGSPAEVSHFTSACGKTHKKASVR